ncbi:MAG: Gfo/Idh/MocA family protein [Anaerorhabdus sp.]
MKFAVVGTNFISDSFMDGINQIKEAQVVAVCSGSRKSAEDFSKKHNIPNVFDNFESLIESDVMDAVYLAVPNSLHYQMSMECLKRGIPTYTEKPFATNFRDAKKMFECAQEKNVYIHDGFVPVYTKNIQIVKSELNSIGKIRQVVFSFGKYSSRYDQYLQGLNPTTFRNDLCNGSLMDLGIYPIGAAIYLFGMPNKVIANGISLETKVDGCGSCILSYEDFEVIIIHSKISNTKIISEIQGEKGIIQIGMISTMNNISIDKGGKCLNINDNTNPFVYQIKEFIANVNNKKIESKIFNHQTSLDIISILDECRKQMNITYPND